MDPLIRRFQQADRAAGACNRDLVLGDVAFRFTGLTERQAGALERWWGPYLLPDAGLAVERTIEVTDGGKGVWLGEPKAGELYRVEPRLDGKSVIAMSYGFAVGRLSGERWRLALDSAGTEPAPQSIENATRWLAARMAVDRGGFALHSAGVLREGRAWLFTGPSGAGKTTAVRLSEAEASLGDDFGLLLPGASGGWFTPPLPFDNAPEIRDRPAEGTYPVAGVWRLFQDDGVHVEPRTGLLAATSLSSCAALPFAMPDLAGPLLDQIGRFCDDGLFGHLHFGLEGGFWEALRNSARGVD